ncbi:MAG: hypothetical protein EPO21_13080 [Chloroflexota bacterium]|nr:MAG: hypothetical protein EPO21_13080 [Chloroflexota bacterium]
MSWLINRPCDCPTQAPIEVVRSGQCSWCGSPTFAPLYPGDAPAVLHTCDCAGGTQIKRMTGNAYRATVLEWTA